MPETGPLPEDPFPVSLPDVSNRVSETGGRVASDWLKTALGPMGPAGKFPEGSPPRAEGLEVLGPLGKGGMGEVWLAREVDTERAVAVKILHARWASEAMAARWHREITLLAAVDHPHLVKLMRPLEMADGRPGFVMEWVDGLVLDEWLEKHPDLTLPERLAVFGDIVGAVACLHENGIIHRDLKPANILVDGKGKARIVDFGLARLQDEAPGKDGISTEGRVGTLHFMAPEQAENGPGARATPVDVYALGNILHRMIIGAWRVEAGGTASEVLARVLRPPSLPAVAGVKGVSRDLWLILRRTLAVDPERRYRTAGELQGDLRRFAEKRTISARGLTVRYALVMFLKRQARRSAVAAVIGAAVLGAGSVLFWKNRRVAAQNEINLRAAHALTDFTLRELRDELRFPATPSTRTAFPLSVLPAPHKIRPLEVNADGSLDLRYYKALLADLRAATTEGRKDFRQAMGPAGEARELFMALSDEFPQSQQRQLDAVTACLTVARLQHESGLSGECVREATGILTKIDRMIAGPLEDTGPAVRIRCDTLRLLAREAFANHRPLDAVRFSSEMLQASAQLADECLGSSPRDGLPRLAQAAADLATHATAAGEETLFNVQPLLEKATALSRTAHGKFPDNMAAIRGLSLCLFSQGRVTAARKTELPAARLFAEAADLLLALPCRENPELRHQIRTLIEYLVEAAESPPDLESATDLLARIDLSHRLINHLRQQGDETPELPTTRARLYLLQSAALLPDRRGAARAAAMACSLLRPRQMRYPQDLGLAFLTAKALRESRKSAELPESEWDTKKAAHLDRLMEKLREQRPQFAAEEQRLMTAWFVEK